MMFKKLGMIGMVPFLVLAFSVSAKAAAWQPVGGTHDGNALYALYPFEDGVQTAVSSSYSSDGSIYERDGEWVLSNSTDPSKTSYLFSFQAGPPQVDLVNYTIDLSGMYLHGVRPLVNNGSGKFDGWIYDQAIGWNVRPSVWGSYDRGSTYYYDLSNPLVPLVDNGNGSYTATWSYANEVFSDKPSLHPMSLTFQAATPVPAPAAIWLFMSGISGLIARFHWRPKVSQLKVT